LSSCWRGQDRSFRRRSPAAPRHIHETADNQRQSRSDIKPVRAPERLRVFPNYQFCRVPRPTTDSARYWISQMKKRTELRNSGLDQFRGGRVWFALCVCSRCGRPCYGRGCRSGRPERRTAFTAESLRGVIFESAITANHSLGHGHSPPDFFGK
jgi:hypothetical protein